MKLAQIEGARVIALDINEERLAYAKEKMEDNLQVFVAVLT